MGVRREVMLRSCRHWPPANRGMIQLTGLEGSSMKGDVEGHVCPLHAIAFRDKFPSEVKNGIKSNTSTAVVMIEKY